MLQHPHIPLVLRRGSRSERRALILTIAASSSPACHGEAARLAGLQSETYTQGWQLSYSHEEPAWLRRTTSSPWYTHGRAHSWLRSHRQSPVRPPCFYAEPVACAQQHDPRQQRSLEEHHDCGSGRATPRRSTCILHGAERRRTGGICLGNMFNVIHRVELTCWPARLAAQREQRAAGSAPLSRSHAPASEIAALDPSPLNGRIWRVFGRSFKGTKTPCRSSNLRAAPCLFPSPVLLAASSRLRVRHELRGTGLRQAQDDRWVARASPSPALGMRLRARGLDSATAGRCWQCAVVDVQIIAGHCAAAYYMKQQPGPAAPFQLEVYFVLFHHQSGPWEACLTRRPYLHEKRDRALLSARTRRPALRPRPRR